MARTAFGPKVKPRSPRLRLLIVDDSTEGRNSLGRLLELHGFDVACVADGSSALAYLRAEPVPDVVLTDLFLPDLDGREVARAAGARAPKPFIGLITGWSLDAEDPELAEAGIDRLFPKPVDVQQVIRAIREARSGLSEPT